MNTLLIKMEVGIMISEDTSSYIHNYSQVCTQHRLLHVSAETQLHLGISYIRMYIHQSTDMQMKYILSIIQYPKNRIA